MNIFLSSSRTMVFGDVIARDSARLDPALNILAILVALSLEPARLPGSSDDPFASQHAGVTSIESTPSASSCTASNQDQTGAYSSSASSAHRSFAHGYLSEEGQSGQNAGQTNEPILTFEDRFNVSALLPELAWKPMPSIPTWPGCRITLTSDRPMARGHLWDVYDGVMYKDPSLSAVSLQYVAPVSSQTDSRPLNLVPDNSTPESLPTSLPTSATYAGAMTPTARTSTEDKAPSDKTPLPIVIKICRPVVFDWYARDPELDLPRDLATTAIRHEVDIYQDLHDIQGNAIPTFFGAWQTKVPDGAEGDDVYMVVLSKLGPPVASDLRKTPASLR